jgi:hypothetical protein
LDREVTLTARDRAIALVVRLLDGETLGQMRHDDVADVVDALIEAARAPESAHTRALARELGPDEAGAALRVASERVRDRL